MKLTYVWINADKPEEQLEIPFYAVGQQDDVSKAHGTGLTYAERYFLMKFFNIPTDEDDADAKEKQEKYANSSNQLKDILRDEVNKFIQIVNKVVIVGRLTKNPEYRTTPNGISVSTFTLAVNRTFTNSNGEREADFINVVTFKKQADNVNNYLSKGSLVGVEARIQTRNYENNEGQRIYVTEVVAERVHFLDSKGNSQQNNSSQQHRQVLAGNAPFANANGPIEISSDDLPF